MTILEYYIINKVNIYTLAHSVLHYFDYFLLGSLPLLSTSIVEWLLMSNHLLILILLGSVLVFIILDSTPLFGIMNLCLLNSLLIPRYSLIHFSSRSFILTSFILLYLNQLCFQLHILAHLGLGSL